MQTERIDPIQNPSLRAIGRDMSGGGQGGRAFDEALRKQKDEAKDPDHSSDQHAGEAEGTGRPETKGTVEDVVELSDAAREALHPPLASTVGHKLTGDDIRKEEEQHRVDILA